MRLIIILLAITSLFLITGCQSVEISREQTEQIRRAAAKVLPSEARVQVSTKSSFFAKPALVISAHLLEGHSADETSPYVRGNYTTHEKLTRLVKYRCAKILKSVLTEAEIPDVSKIVIQARHGVRQYYYGMPSNSGNDVAMTIYTTGMPINAATNRNWSQVTIDEILQQMKGEKNIIPSLDFQTVIF